MFVRNNEILARFWLFVTLFYHISDFEGHLRPQRDDGAARAASCYIPPINIAGMGLLIVFQRNVLLGRTFLVQKMPYFLRMSA